MNQHRLANLYDAILEFKRDHDGATPPIRWLSDKCDIPSTSTTRYYLDELESMGLIKRPFIVGSKRFSVIKVTGAQWVAPGKASNVLSS